MESAGQYGISLGAALDAISQVGDLSMGQPLGHSQRVGRLARQLAQAAGESGEQLAAVEQVALLRWSGCTANAEDFNHLVGDDVAGRRAMLDNTLSAEDMQAVHRAAPLAVVHCEVAGEIGKTLELGSEVETALRRVFETYDGSGRPLGLSREQIPQAAYQVVLAGDLDILSRAHGVDHALRWIGQQADKRYPAELANVVVENGAQWLSQLHMPPDATRHAGAQRPVCMTLVGDMIDLKLPFLAGHSRQVAHVAVEAGRLWGLSQPSLTDLGRAALIHGLGRAAVANHVWNTAGPLPYGATERVHLVPYWTQKATREIDELRVPGNIAAHAYERLDGSGYFRGAPAESLCPENRLFAAAVAWVALRGARPWRAAHSESEAAALLKDEARRGLFDGEICDAVIAAARGERKFAQAKSALLSPRECDILLAISKGGSNKEVARLLDISPSTVRTHMESIFRKLGCSTRAAATLKGLTLGLIA